jgi:hypothetical protein
MGFNSAFKGLKRLESEVDHSPPSSNKVKTLLMEGRNALSLEEPLSPVPVAALSKA